MQIYLYYYCNVHLKIVKMINFVMCFLLLLFSPSILSNSLWPHGLQHARLPCPSPTLEFAQTHVPWVSDAIQPSHPLLSPSPPAPNPSQHQGLFQWVSSSHQVAKVLEFQLHHQSFQWTPGTDSFRMDWLDLLAVQKTLKNLLQHCSSKAPIFWCSAFFIVQLSYPYMYYSLNTLGGKKWPFFFLLLKQ